MKFSLRNLLVNRVALVDKGANFDQDTRDGAHILLYKRDETEKSDALASVHVDRPIGDDKPNKAAVRGKKESPVTKKSIFEKLAALVKSDTSMSDAEKKAAEDAMSAAAAEPDADDVAKKAADEIAKKAADDLKKADTIEKRMELLEKRATDAETRATAAETIAKAERDTRLNAEQEAVLKSFRGVSVDVAKDTAVFRKLADTDPASYDRLVGILKAADATIVQSALFKEFGSGRTGTGSAWSQLEAKADALVEKSGSKLTREQAIEKVSLENPALVRQYRAEQQ